MINQRQTDWVMHLLDDAITKGAKVKLDGGSNGCFIEPTILSNTPPDMLIMREETFGPMVPVIW